ncbi:MAG: DNA polymerase II [Nanoarchaeota archaeon]
MKSINGFITDIDYSAEEDGTKVYIYGKLENGESFVSIHSLTPYFFIKESDYNKNKKLFQKFNIEKTKLTNFKGEKITKVSHKIHTELNKLHHVIHKKMETYEADVKPSNRFIIDNNLSGSISISGDYQSSERVNRIYVNQTIKPSSQRIDLKVVSIDTESDKQGNLYCIGLYSSNYKKCFIVSDKKLNNATPCKTEEECLEKFREELIKLDPDVLTGWNFIDFDLVFLQDLFKKHKIKFDIGRNNDNLRLRIEGNFFRSSSASITGRQVLDGLNLIKDPFIQEAPLIRNANFESYTLEDVSRAILNKGKLLAGKERHKEIIELYNNNQQKLVDYNLMDCQLVYEILDKTKMIDLLTERSELTGLTFDRLAGSIAAFDSLYLREARSRNLVSPTTVFTKTEERIIGGYVYSSNPGIYNNVLVFDFKSLYPSIIKTFNIDPASLLEKPEKDSIESPNKAYFRNSRGILPEIIDKLHQAREKAKRESRDLANYAIKITMNSFFGVLASPNCRYYNFNMANSITHFAQFIIKLTAKEIEKLGYKIIYQDTDSCFVETNLEKNKNPKISVEIQNHINDFYKNYIKKEYGRESFLELEFKKLYLALMIPKVRGKEEAAKKRYAGLIEKEGKEELDIVGLEAIRGDWTEAAQDFQKELLLKTFHHESVDKFIKDFIKKIKSGELDRKLVYRKSIRKNLEEYTKTTPPHVKAARKMIKLEGNIIEYLITDDGPEPIQNLKHKIDYEHYIKKQIEPIANQILILLGKDLGDSMKSQKQARLFF